jgi:hypothetical protein
MSDDDELTEITIGDITLDNTVEYDDWLQQYVDLELDYSNISYDSSLGANDIKLNGGGEEMLRVAQDGFYVRGVKVEADAKEAQAVYNAFKQWMTYAILNGEINNR